jgi:hypothetical protein
MKRFLTIIAGCAGLALLAPVARAEEGQPQQNKSLLNIAAGVVTKIDRDKKTFEIKATDEKILVLAVGEKTKFSKDDKDITLADLAVGNYLLFTFKANDDGSAIAGRVFVREKAPTVEKPPAEEKPPVEQK